MAGRKGLITTAELAQLFGNVSLQAIYKQIRTNHIESYPQANKRRLVSPGGVRSLLEKRNFRFPKTNVSFQIVKGGTGKTTLAYALAVRASHYGARVLVIDFDQQGNLSRSLNVDARQKPVWLNVFRDGEKIENAVVEVEENLHLIPSNLNNSRLDTELTGSSANLRDMIADKIAPIRKNFDFVIMDCPPAINKINTAVTCASDAVIVPVNPEPYAVDGLHFTLSEIKRVKKEFKTQTKYQIIWNRYDARERLGVVYMHQIAGDSELSKHILPVVIRTDASLKNAVFEAKSIFEMGKKSNAKEDIDHFAREYLGINHWRESQKQAVA